jgi:hypothetical protein
MGMQASGGDCSPTKQRWSSVHEDRLGNILSSVTDLKVRLDTTLDRLDGPKPECEKADGGVDPAHVGSMARLDNVVNNIRDKVEAALSVMAELEGCI